MTISLFGYGATNQAIANTLSNVNIFDDKFDNINKDTNLNNLLPSYLFDPNSSSIEIVTPGIAPSNPLVQKAKNIISEYDFFYKDFPYTIWISGTNGKTTTTQMLQYLLNSKGSLSGGNIGTPIVRLNKDAPIWILETSSFTLHYTKIAKPNIYILLPIEPDHLSWHGSFEEYERAKLKPLDRLQEGEMAIVPYKYKDYPTNGFLVTYSNSIDLAKYFDIDIGLINHKEPFLLDALLALSVTKALYDECDYTLINSFMSEAHKLEEFKDNKNRLWIDDSKATNISASTQALLRYKNQQIHLIVGGDDKGVDMSNFISNMKNYNIKLYTIGSNSHKLALLCNQFNIKYQQFEFLKDAIMAIDKELEDGIAILSPAAASLDQFSSYKDRGEQFKLFIKNLEV